MENPNNILLQGVFEQLADYESERVKFWWEIRDRIDEVEGAAQYSGLKALYCPEIGESDQV